MQQQGWHKVTTSAIRPPLIHEYFGFTGKRYLGVQEHDDHLSLMHIYGGIVCFWRFTYDGRIRNIGFNVKENNWYHHALTLKKTNASLNWREGFARYNFLPEQASSIQDDILCMHPLDQYNNLIARAKKYSGDILQALHLDDAETKRKPQQLPLATIASNPRLQQALIQTALLEPELKVMNRFELNIQYLPIDS
jgi:hypothetical protein